MIRCAAVLCAALVGTQAFAAEAALVRAGEHSGFSRIAIDIRGLKNWSYTVDGRKVTLSFPERGIRFDTSSIYPRRRVSRVLGARGAIEDGTSTLSLDLGCDCAVDAYLFSSNMVVIDIKDAAGATRRSASAPASKSDSDSAPASASAPESAPESVMAENEHEAPRPDRPVAPKPASRDPDAESTSAAIAEAQARLLEQLTRAAEQGLVSFKEPTAEAHAGDPIPAPKPVEPAIEESDSTATPAPAPAPEPTPVRAKPFEAQKPTGDAPQLEAHLVYDPSPLSDASDAEERSCPPDAWFDAQAWSDGAEFPEQVAKLRRRLYGEFDRADDDAVRTLARLYIHEAFGEEAAATLRMQELDDDESRMLVAMAQVVRGEMDEAGAQLAATAGCHGGSALWRAAAGVRAADESDDEEVLDALAGTPAPLRAVLGPKVAFHFMELNRLAAAERALKIVERSVDARTPELNLAMAELELRLDRFADAERNLRRIIAENPANSVEAMVRLAAAYSERGLPPPSGFVERVADAAFLHRGDESGPKLRVAEIQARAGAGGLPAALDIIARELEERPSRADLLRQVTRDVLVAARADASGPAEYAAAVARRLDLLTDGPESDPARLTVADEAIRIGLGNLALRALAPALARDDPEAKIVAAHAYLSLDEGRAALEMLAGLDDERAESARELALAMIGDYRRAYEIAGAQDPERSAELAWRAREWQASAELSADPLRASLSRFMAELRKPAEQTPGAPASLESARAELESSRRTREVLGEAMADG